SDVSEKPRSTRMDGSATFTIVVSSTIMRSPRQRTTRASQRLLPSIVIRPPPLAVSPASTGPRRGTHRSPARPSGLGLEGDRQPEERKQARGVEEEAELADAPVRDLDHLERPRLVASAGGA